MKEVSQSPIKTKEGNKKGVKDSIKEDLDDSSSVASSTDFILNMSPFSQRSSTSPEKSGGRKDDTVEEVQVVGNKNYQANDIKSKYDDTSTTAAISIARRSEAGNDISEQIIEKISEISEDTISPAMTSFSSWSKSSSTLSSFSGSRSSTNDDDGEHRHTSNFDSDSDCNIPFAGDKKHSVASLPKTTVTEKNREATTTTTKATTVKVGTRKSRRATTMTATIKAAASITTKKIPTTTKSLSSVRTTSADDDDDNNDNENDSDDNPFANLSRFNRSKRRQKFASSSDDDDDDDFSVGSDVTSGEYTSTSEYSMTNLNKFGNDEDKTILSTNHHEEGQFRPGHHVWVNLGGKESQAAVIHSIVDATAVIVKWPIAGLYEEIPIDVLVPMFDHSINGAVVSSQHSRRSRKKTDMYAPIVDDRRKVKEEEEVEEEEDEEVEEEYLSDEGETGTTMKGAGVIVSSTSKSSQGKWSGESTGSEQQNKSGRGGRRTPGRGWTKGLLLGGKDVCWMSPDAQIKFSSWEAAQKFAELRKKFNSNESLAWNEHLRVSAGVADPRFQLSAIYSNTRATNKTSDTNGDSTDHSDKDERYVDHLIGATIYVSDGKFRGKFGTLEERGFGGWCTISGIPKRIKINSCSIVNDGKIDLKAARAMQRFMPPVMTPSQMAKALASTNNSAITLIEPPNDFHEGQHVLVVDGKTEYQAVIVSIDSPKKYKRRMATVRWSTWVGRIDEVEVKYIRPMFSLKSFLDPPVQSTIRRNRIQTDRLSIVPGSKTYVGTIVDSKRCNSLVSKRKSHEDPSRQSTIKRKRIQIDRLSVVSGSKSYVGTTIDSKQCNSPVTKMTSHERADNMNTCKVKNAMIVLKKLDRDQSAKLGWEKSRCTNRKFFDQVSKLKLFKMKHGHLNVSYVKNKGMYKFCYDIRIARRDIVSGKGSTRILTQERIAALDAIGFDWMLSSSSAVRNTCQPPEEFRRKRGRPTSARKERRLRDFFDRVGDLKSFKTKHGHLNINCTKNKSMYNFCHYVRSTRRDIMSGKGSIRTGTLTKERIAALDAIGFDWKLSSSSGQPRKRGRLRSATMNAIKEKKRISLKCKGEEIESYGVNFNEYKSLWKHYMEQSVRKNEELLGCDMRLRKKVARCSLLRSKNDTFRREVHRKILILHKEGGRINEILRILKLMKEHDSGELPKPDLYKLMDEILGPRTFIDDNEVEILDFLETADDKQMTCLARDGQHPKYDFELDDSDSVGQTSFMDESAVLPNIDCKIAATAYAKGMAEDIAESPQCSTTVIKPFHQYQEMEAIDLTDDDDLDLDTAHQKLGNEKCTCEHIANASNASVDDGAYGHDDISESPQGSKKVINPCHKYQDMETIDLTEDDDLDLNTAHQKSGEDKCTHKHTSSATNGRVDDGTNHQRMSANDQHKHSNFVDLSQN